MAKPVWYNFFWRWHFYAGLIVTPIILVMAVTGGIYLLQPQLEGWMYHDRLHLAAPYSGEVEHDSIIQAAKERLEAKQMHSYQPSSSPTESAQVVLTTEQGVKLTAYLHPMTQELIGTVNEQWRLSNISRNIHKNLMLGTAGRVITELAACWLIVMIATGLYLWWPRGNKTRGKFKPNTQAKGRNLWREFHAVTGGWIGVWVLALLFTGLPWSMVWGGLLSDISTKAGEGFPQAIFKARPASTSSEALPEVTMNHMIATARAKGAHHGFKIEYPWWEGGSYVLMPARHAHSPAESYYLFFDRRSGEVLDEYRWDDLGKVGRLTSLGVAFHEGRLFGTANQLLNLTVVVLLITMCITGPVMWWKRKPQKSLGAPRLQEGIKLPRRVIIAIVLTGIFLPLFGASVLGIWLGERCMQRRTAGGDLIH